MLVDSSGQKSTSAGWRSHGDTVLEVINSPQEHEWELLDLDSLLKEIHTKAASAREKHRRISEELRRAVSGGRIGSLKRQKSEAHKEVLRCESKIAPFKKVVAALHEARERVAALLDCPTCETAADSGRDFEPRGRACFNCVCRDCGTEWGTRLCNCSHRYAVMLPSGDFMDTQDETTGWEDRVYGCDILALPARKSDGEWGIRMSRVRTDRMRVMVLGALT